MAQKLYRRAVVLHLGLTGKALGSVPPMLLSDYAKMKAKSDRDGAVGILRGFYQTFQDHQETVEPGGKMKYKIVSFKEAIYIVDGLQEEEFVITALHELTHDWLGENFPGIKVAPLWIEEGACQYLAFQYTLKMKWERAGRKIMDSPDEVYGKGFKFYKEKFGFKDWAKVLVWLETQGYRKAPPVGAKRKK